MIVDLPGPADTDALGHRLAAVLAARTQGGVMTLTGELGAGKTALARAMITALGYAGPVVSPSYTLVEPYEVAGGTLYHLDLYRLGDPEELEFLGIRELAPESDLLLIEWPEQGRGFLPPADLDIRLAYWNNGRRASLQAFSAGGLRWLTRLGGANGPL